MIIPAFEIEEIDLYWLAGLLEGEGSFSIYRNTVAGKVYLYPKIVVSMTDRDIIERVCVLFQTKVYDIPISSMRSNQLPQFRATLTGAKAAGLMNLLLPIMGTRRSQRIREVLDHHLKQEETRDKISKSQKERWKRYKRQ